MMHSILDKERDSNYMIVTVVDAMFLHNDPTWKS